MNAENQLKAIPGTKSLLVTRLQGCLESKNLTLHELSKALDIPYANLYRLFNGDAPDPKTSLLKQLADYFNVSTDSLLSKEDAEATPHCVPIIDWEQAGTLDSIRQLDLNRHMSWQTLSKESAEGLSKECFALASQPSMAPLLPFGTVLIVDKLTAPRDGDLVLIRIKGTQDITLRELSMDPPNWLLSPVVKNSEILRFSKTEHKIIGVVMVRLFHARNHR